eukprot:4881345-Prorocentrum_lima.AAC.1
MQLSPECEHLDGYDDALPRVLPTAPPGHPSHHDDDDESIMRTDTPTVVVESGPPAPSTPHPPVDTASLVAHVLEQSNRAFQTWFLQAQETLSHNLALQLNT